MRVGRLQFSPTLWPTLAFVLVFPGLLALGFWQLDRAAQKQALFDAFARSAQQAVPLTDVQSPEIYQRVKAQGHYLGSHQFLLDNMIHDGHAGYYVLTPFVLTNGQWVMVNRGWQPWGGSRRNLPDVTVSAERRTITGRIDNLPVPGIRLEKEKSATRWPRLAQFPTMPQLAQQLRQLDAIQADTLLNGMILLDAEAADGYLRDWQPQLMPPERHLGYAVTWFGLAATLLIIYLVVNTTKDTKDS